MGQITIIKRDGTQINLFRTEPFCTVSQAVQNFTLMGDDNVQLAIQSAEIMDFSIGDKILIGGDEYSIRTNANREIIGENRFTYEVTFYGVMYDLMKTMYRDTDINGKSSKSTFDLTYSLSDLVKVIIYNLNRDYPGIWSFDAANCPVTDPKTFSFSKQNCLQVLQNICNAYGYEFRIDLVGGVRTIKIGKFGSVVTPPAGNTFFEWGKGAGLYKLKEQKVDDKSIITRLWVEGGTENIKSGYRNYSDRLQLPMRRLNNHAHTLSNGTVIPAQSEYIGITDDEKRYIEDEDLKNKLGSIEDVEQYDIHPARTGEVTALGDTIYSFVDSTMDFDLNEKDTNGTKWLIAETSAKITFITGKLAGQQFEMKDYNHSSKAFTIIKNTDERGLSVPTSDSEAFRFVVGDKYKITDINLPDAYVDDAEENLWYAGYDDFHLNRKLVRAQYVLTFDRSYFINALPADSETSVFRVGDYVPVKDVRFNLEKNIRIQKLSRNLLLEHDYTLTISDITTVPIATQIVQEVLEHEIIIEANRLRDTAKARRAWRTTEELRNMVYDTDGYFDSENIKPNSIDTNMLTVGSKSQQFILMDIVLEANVNGLPNRFDVSAGALIHLTIDDSGAKIWNMAATSVTLAESGGYYVFAKCSKSGNQGVFYITQQQIKVEPADDPNNYYFQVGIIGSLHADDNFRDFTTTYGFTRINGNTITTGKIVTSDGECYLDLDGNKFRIGDANSALTWANAQLILKGVLVQSQSGDISQLAVFRGGYNPDYIYYKGDEVTYNNGTETCTYRYTNATPGKGQLPTNTVYWAVVAKGAKGDQGIQGLQGIQGVKGDQGIPGITGTDGKTTYFHVKYSNYADGSNMNDTGGLYIGTYVDFTATDSTDKTKYKWVLIKGVQGDKGDQGIPGVNGSNGLTSYLHIKYSNDGGVTFTTNNGEDTGAYIGQYTDFVQLDSSDPTKYTWSKITGADGSDGTPGTDGINGSAGEYYEYRYAKNGSTVTPPALDTSVPEPAGWSKTMPTLGTLEYLWCTIAKKSSLVDNTMVHLPISASDITSIADTSGKGRNATLSNGATVASDSRGYVLSLNGAGESQIPMDLPWGKSFTICLWAKTDMSLLSWMLNCYLGREYIEQSIAMTANQWAHLAFRFNEKTITVFKDGTQIYIGSTKEAHAGFSLYDDNLFGTNASFDEIRVFDSALSASDIAKVIAGTVDNLVQAWSAPVRVNGVDGEKGDKGDKGDKGENPVLAFRGIYDAAKTYYGTNTRLDAVKYNGVYYIARIDAGSFTNIVPTDTSKWNTFGAQLETIATNLLLAEGANIGDWFMSGGKIVSTLADGNKITLDASAAEILIVSASSGGDYSMDTGFGSRIRINANSGCIEIVAVNPPSYSTGTAYMSPTGIFANLAGTNGMPASSGFTHQASIVGLGFANVNKSAWAVNANESIVAGIYGRASNNGDAPAYGGFFYDLYAGGLTLGKKSITSTGTTYLNSSDSLIIGYTSAQATVYLPSTPKEGQIVFFKQWWTGFMRVYPRSGQLIYDDSSVNDYYDFGEGWAGTFMFTIGYVDGVKKEAWLVSRFKY